jgi:malate dehydrogenase (oxaloacetate-decarboxylating)(NADP+)
VRTDATPRWTVCGIAGAVGSPDPREATDVLVFPKLSAPNICYELLSLPGGAEAIGPVLLGTEKPVHILQRGATVAEIVNLASIAVVDAETRHRQTALDL